MTKVSECFFPQNTKSPAPHCTAAEGRGRGCCFVWDAALWTRQNFTGEGEVGIAFNPFLDQLSLQATKPLCVRKANKELQWRSYPEPFKRCLTGSEEKIFPVGAEEMLLFAGFGNLFNLIGLNSKTEGRHYLLFKLIHL